MGDNRRGCMVYRNDMSVHIPYDIVFPLFNELIEKSISFEFINARTASKGTRYWFYIDEPDIDNVKKIVRELKKRSE